MKKLILATVCCLSLLAAERAARADIFEFWVSGLAGGGWGMGSNSNYDFYRKVRGGAAGAEIGAKVLFIGLFADYLRWFGGDTGADLFTINLGGDWGIGLTERLKLVIRASFGYYQGNVPDEVDLVNTRGIGARAGVGLRFTFWKFFSIGVTPTFGWHYFFGGANVPINDAAQSSHGFDFQALAYLRFGIGI